VIVPRLVATILAVIALAPQRPARDSDTRTIGTASISGIIVSDDAGHRPLRKTTVTLGSGETARATLTDDSGLFVFSGLPAGRYPVVATRAGWVTTAYGAKRPGGAGTAVVVSDGQRVGDITIALLHGAVLTGTIRDENGRPISGVGLGIMRYVRSPADGSRFLQPVNMDLGSEPSDDQGAYRLFGLPPGDYLLVAGSGFGAADAHAVTPDDVRRALTPRDAATLSRPAPDLPSMKYVPIFYPGTPDASAARPVTVGAGEERSGLDFQIQLVTAARISGLVTGPDGQSVTNASVTIFRVDQPAMGLLLNWFINSARTDRDGRFTIPGVAPGRYAVQASLAGAGGRGAPTTAGSLWAYEPIAMPGQDASVALSLRPGPTVSGQLSFAGGAPPTTLPATRVILQPVIGPDGVGSMPVPGAIADADRRFVFQSIMPGRYRVSASSIRSGDQTWWPISALLDGRDLLDQPFDAIGTADVSGITIAYTDRPTELSGLMLDAAGHAAPEYHVVAFSTDRSDWLTPSRRIQQVRPAADGRFVFRNLPPGEYFLGAVTDVEDNEWFDPAFLEPLAAASIKLTLAASEQKTQDIRIR
jgi:uncharacterized protein (DUF2141 family)